MAEFLLIHGASHGAWCWREMLPLLNAGGHTARAIDLPSHGDDPTPVNDVTLDLYADAILAAIDTPVVLVGHSMAGYAISAAALKAPELMEKMIYVCAYLPKTGETLADRRFQALRQPLTGTILKSDDGKSYTFAPEKCRDLFYQDCPKAVAADAILRLCPQAVAPTSQALTVTPALTNIPRHYIRCMDDRTIPPEFQVTMTQDWPAQNLHEMDCGHSPFFAKPDRLAELFLQIAES
ncbi:MAG: alpha/beta fold hydrolase [Marinosulfonomonas sp.]